MFRINHEFCAWSFYFIGEIKMGITNYFVVINRDEVSISLVASVTEMQQNMLRERGNTILSGDCVDHVLDVTALGFVEMSSDHPRDRRGGLVVHNSTIGVVQLGS